jgi:hypothetical protein
MKLNHLFYDSNVSFKSISKKRIVLSVILGLASAVLIYSFFYALRETDRMMYLDFEERPIVVPKNDRQLFNLFFAAISIVLGNSVAISFLFSRPQKIFSRRNNKRNRILNDQAFLGFNFIHWFAKVWFMFGTFYSQFMGSKFIINFLWPSVLLLIVLYFDAWKTLSALIKKHRYKIILIHFSTFLLLTFCLSRLNVIDYESIDKVAHSVRPTIQVPNSVFKEELHERRYYNNLVFKMNFTNKENVSLFNEYYEPIELNDAYNYIDDWEDEIIEELRHKAILRLRANKDIPIKSIKEFEVLLLQYGQYRIIYEIANHDESTKNLGNNEFKHKISPSLLDVFPRKPTEPPRPPFGNYLQEYEFTDTIRIDVQKKIRFNESFITIQDLTTKIKNSYSSSTLFEYTYTKETTYQDYINVLSAHKQAILDLKRRHSKYNYDEMILEIHRNQFSIDKKLNNERSRLNKLFPLLITEQFK